MNLCQRASRLLPLVLFASLAHAGVIFNPGSGCEATPTQGDVTGIKCYGSSEGEGGASLSFNGTGSGTFSTSTLPFDYDFTVNRLELTPLGITSATAVNWSGNIEVKINGIFAGGQTLQGLFGQQITGSFDVETPNGSALNSWNIYLSVRSVGAKTGISLNVPKNSLDLPGAQQTTVPEPAALGLVAAGLLGIGLYSRRRARQ